MRRGLFLKYVILFVALAMYVFNIGKHVERQEAAQDAADAALGAFVQALRLWPEPALEAAADGNSWFDPNVLRQAVEVFQQLYLDHIVLEESLAYPEARGRIDPALLESMGREMAKRRAVRDAKAAKA